MPDLMVGEFTPGSSVLVQNIAPEVTVEQLKRFFEILGPLNKLFIYWYV